MSEFPDGTDMTNPEYRDIPTNTTTLTEAATVVISETEKSNAAIESDMTVDYRDYGEDTDRRYSMVLGGEQ